MARLTIYLPDALDAEMREYAQNGTTVSGFVRDAVEMRLAPLRPRCSSCGECVARTWQFCAACGAAQADVIEAEA